MAAPPDVLVGIDFGTTTTGVFVSCKKAGLHKVIREWPSDGGPKVPSKIFFGPDETVSWGFDTPIEEPVLEWVKLCLLQSDDLSQDVKQSEVYKRHLRTLNSSGKAAKQVIAEYLRRVWKHVRDGVKKEFQPHILPGSRISLQFVMTVPAVWPGYAQAIMRQALNESGMLGPDKWDTFLSEPTNPVFLTEPEAAVHHLITVEPLRSQIQKDDLFLVCDCGGGTVDCTAYKIGALEPQVILDECVPGVCHLSGSAILDGNIENLLKQKLQEALLPEDFSLLNEEWYRVFLADRWESKKRLTSVMAPWTVGCRIPVHPRNMATVHFSTEEMRAVWEPMVTGIRTVVNDMIQTVKQTQGRPPDRILFCGGIACNSYFQEECRDFNNIRVEHFRPFDCLTAVCTGAVKSRYHENGSTMVVSRKSRVSLGFSDGHGGVTWFIEKGDSLSVEAMSATRTHVPTSALVFSPNTRCCMFQIYQRKAKNEFPHLYGNVSWVMADQAPGRTMPNVHLGVSSADESSLRFHFHVFQDGRLIDPNRVTLEFAK